MERENERSGDTPVEREQLLSFLQTQEALELFVYGMEIQNIAWRTLEAQRMRRRLRILKYAMLVLAVITLLCFAILFIGLTM